MSPEDLEKSVSEIWGEDIDCFDRSIETCFGQSIEIHDSNGWSKLIEFEHVGYSVVRLAWRKQFHSNPLVEWIYRCCVIERLQTHIDFKPMAALAALIGGIDVKPNDRNIARALSGWAAEIANRGVSTRRPYLSAGAIALHRWCVETMVPGFSEHELPTSPTRPRNQAKDHGQLFMDQESGPFNLSELNKIEEALRCDPTWTRQRAMYYLCRDWGLRPIQLALLRESDYGEDGLGPFVMVPSVKGARRAHLRRHPSNLRKRYISDDTAEALKDHLEANKVTVAEVRAEIERELSILSEQTRLLPIPMFPRKGTPRRTRVMWINKKLRDYTLHSDSVRLSREIASISSLVKIPLRGQGGEESIVHITAYRLRRTKATGMVISGHTPEDVAEALDHSSTASVKSYFHFSKDLIDFVNSTHEGSSEIKEAVETWAGRFSSSKQGEVSGLVRVASLGLCASNEVCPYHPTVSCYACSKFKPFREADHQKARQNIIELQIRVRESSTGPVGRQINHALEGVDAVIKAVDNEQE